MAGLPPAVRTGFRIVFRTAVLLLALLLSAYGVFMGLGSAFAVAKGILEGCEPVPPIGLV